MTIFIPVSKRAEEIEPRLVLSTLIPINPIISRIVVSQTPGPKIPVISNVMMITSSPSVTPK